MRLSSQRVLRFVLWVAGAVAALVVAFIAADAATNALDPTRDTTSPLVALGVVAVGAFGVALVLASRRR